MKQTKKIILTFYDLKVEMKWIDESKKNLRDE